MRLYELDRDTIRVLRVVMRFRTAVTTAAALQLLVLLAAVRTLSVSSPLRHRRRRGLNERVHALSCCGRGAGA